MGIKIDKHVSAGVFFFTYVLMFHSPSEQLNQRLPFDE